MVRNKRHEKHFVGSVEKFADEAHAIAKLDHGNIIRVQDVFSENNTAYMVMDFVDGQDLQQIIEHDPKRLTPKLVIDIVTKLLGALDQVHKNGLLHRDISPDNVLLDKNDNPVLIDFGSARDDASKQTRVLSTLNVIKDGYSPQEFYITGSNQSAASDLYSLAATAYHCITKELPPGSQSRLAALAEKRKGPYVPLEGRIDNYPKPFLRAIDKALNIIPKDRLQSASEWLSALSASSASTTKAGGGGKGLLIGGAVAAILALGVGYTFLQSQDTSVAEEANQEEVAVEKPEPQEEVAEILAPAAAETTQTSEEQSESLMGGVESIVEETVEEETLADAPVIELILPESENPSNDTPESVRSVDLEPTRSLVELRLPFSVNDVLIGETAFPAITTIQNSEASEDWIALGVRLLALNGELLPSADILEEFLLGQFGTQKPASVDVKMRIQRSNSTTIEEVPLSLRFVQRLSLNTGLEVTFSEVEGNPIATITGLPTNATSGMMLGDQVIKDLASNAPLNDIQSFQNFVEGLNNESNAPLSFEIRRNGETISVDPVL